MYVCIYIYVYISRLGSTTFGISERLIWQQGSMEACSMICSKRIRWDRPNSSSASWPKLESHIAETDSKLKKIIQSILIYQKMQHFLSLDQPLGEANHTTGTLISMIDGVAINARTARWKAIVIFLILEEGGHCSEASDGSSLNWLPRALSALVSGSR